jgi:hypothetical protein
MSSEDELPTGDEILDPSLIEKLDRLLPQLVANVEESMTTGRIRTHRFSCRSCGTRNEVTETERDPEQDRKALDTLTAVKVRLTAAAREGAKDSSGAAAQVLGANEDLSNEEIAGRIVLLSAQLGRPPESLGMSREERRATIEALAIEEGFIDA